MKFINKIQIISTLLGFIVLSSLHVNALEVIQSETLNVDTKIISNDSSYITPSQITVVPIFLEEQITNAKWYRGLYYYTVDRLGFNDIPFHYVITSNGEVYKGNNGGDERKILIDGAGDAGIVVAYLSNGSLSSFDPRAQKNLESLLIDIANRNAINPSNIQVTAAKFVKNVTNKTILFKSEPLFGNWENSIKKIINIIKPQYKPITKEYSVQILAVTLPEEPVNPGDEITASITLKNTGSNGLYGGSNSEIVLTKTDNNSSSFYINNIWLSQTQIGILGDNLSLLPSEEKRFDIKIKAPLFFGEKSETFELKTLTGQKINSTNVNLKLVMKRTDRKIVEIKNTELGYLRVRDSATTFGNEIARVTTGQRFFMLQDAGNGFIKIDLGNGQSGWVANWYLNFI